MIRPAAAAALLLLPSLTLAGPLSRAARVVVGADSIAAGAKAPWADLDCAAGKVQHTVSRCALSAAALPGARSLGRRVVSMTLNVHFQGDVVNMSVEFEPSLGFDLLLGDYRAALGSAPRVEYWADDEHLYASYIWVDGETEVELTRAVKGAPSGGGVRAYISSLAGGRPLSPDDGGRAP